MTRGKSERCYGAAKIMIQKKKKMAGKVAEEDSEVCVVVVHDS